MSTISSPRPESQSRSASRGSIAPSVVAAAG
jgi:hypothetical protein